ncbi:MAG TPA: response regulator FixJ [Caulobacteraceae bacterium]|nr:response regulator FixJ [Caulobacteraceae bacterium]
MSAGKVHLIDDDADVRDSLTFLLSTADIDVDAYDSAKAFLAVAGEADGCIVTDVRMPEMDGLELTRRLKGLGVRLPIIVITGHADVPLAVEAMKIGVSDFIEKPFDDEVILGAVERALKLGAAPQSAEGSEFARRIAELSPRERQVLDGLVQGKPNKVIARDLDISPRTVEIYRAHVMTKTQAQSLSELVRMAILAGVA